MISPRPPAGMLDATPQARGGKDAARRATRRECGGVPQCGKAVIRCAHFAGETLCLVDHYKPTGCSSWLVTGNGYSVVGPDGTERHRCPEGCGQAALTPATRQEFDALAAAEAAFREAEAAWERERQEAAL